MEDDEYLCKVETKDGDLYFFTKWFGENYAEFDLILADGRLTWKGKVTEVMLEDMAKKVDMNIKDYTSQTFNALTGNTSGTDTFIYQTIKHESTLELNWKKQLEDGVKFHLGSISLILCEDSQVLMKSILDFSIARVSEYKDTIKNMKCEMEQLEQDRGNAILRLDKFIVGKEEMELDLFQKFVTVLNDKKAKIRRLQDTIEQQAKKLDELPTRTVENPVDKESTNDETRDGDTDVEMDESQDKDKTEQKATTSSNIGSCLFQDEEDAPPVMKRRRRQPSRQPVRTPSKPVLPEVKTIKRTSSNASSTSTNSSESKQSDSNRRRSRRNKTLSTFPDDVEDLFGDMA